MRGLELTEKAFVASVPTYVVRGLIRAARTLSTFEDLGMEAFGSLNDMAFDGITDYADGEIVLLYQSKRLDPNADQSDGISEDEFVDAPELDGLYRIVTIGHSHEDPRFERVPTATPLFEVQDGNRYGQTFWKNLTLLSQYVPNRSPFVLEELQLDEDCTPASPPPPAPPDIESWDATGTPVNINPEVGIWIENPINGATDVDSPNWGFDNEIGRLVGIGIEVGDFQVEIVATVAKDSGTGTVELATAVDGVAQEGGQASVLVGTDPVIISYSAIVALQTGSELHPSFRFDTEGIYSILALHFQVSST